MKINILSDLHLECSWLNHTPSTNVDVIILAGDISSDEYEIMSWIYDNCKEHTIIAIAGNHEFYGYKIFPNHYEILIEEANETNADIRYLQNTSTIVDGVRFIGTTLWTDFNLDPNVSVIASLSKAPVIMNDYFHIIEKVEMDGYYNTKKLAPSTVLAAHQESLAYIIDELETPHDGPTVVVTHHGVTNQSIHQLYKPLANNEYFASDLEHIIQKYQPEFWIHGHTHQSLDYNIGKTRVIANPRGYADIGKAENPTFDPHFSIEIG